MRYVFSASPPPYFSRFILAEKPEGKQNSLRKSLYAGNSETIMIILKLNYR